MMHTTQETSAPRRLRTPAGVTIFHERHGTGPPLLLVHGSFCDHRSNWQFVAPSLAEAFTVHALARRGRGETDSTEGHSVEDEAADVAALIEAIGEPVHMLGHSYGALIALAAAPLAPQRIAKLVLYEPPLPAIITPACIAALEDRAASGDWEGFTATFFRLVVSVSEKELAELRESPIWAHFVKDAPATRHEIQALPAYDFDPANFTGLSMPVMLQIGTESPRENWATDALATALPNATIAELPEQGHDAVFTAPDLYARQVIDFLRA
ncbi:MAG: alpha/beta hydrolase [Pararhodobacter sp.]|nr:alpha/beta hydrolase [Pararhodobacter sp.]